MKKYAIFALFSYLLILLSPIALAGEITDYTFCDFKDNNIDAEVFNKDEEAYEEEKKVWIETYQSTLAGEYEDKNASDCGALNGVTGFYEKGDCTAAGFVITEISEVIGGTTELDDNKIIDVYKGTCCLIGIYDNDNNYECEETSDIYADTFKNCNDVAANCSKRQWIIASSGAGIIKIYVKQIYGWAAGTIGFIVVVTIVINGVRISVSGISGDITDAKNKIFQAIGALVLLFLSGLILFTINPTFFS